MGGVCAGSRTGGDASPLQGRAMKPAGRTAWPSSGARPVSRACRGRALAPGGGWVARFPGGPLTHARMCGWSNCMKSAGRRSTNPVDVHSAARALRGRSSWELSTVSIHDGKADRFAPPALNGRLRVRLLPDGPALKLATAASSGRLPSSASGATAGAGTDAAQPREPLSLLPPPSAPPRLAGRDMARADGFAIIAACTQTGAARSTRKGETAWSDARGGHQCDAQNGEPFCGPATSGALQPERSPEGPRAWREIFFAAAPAPAQTPPGK